MLGRRTDDVHLELRVPALVDIHADDEELTIRHLDPQLTAVGAHHGSAYGAASHGGEGLGDTAQILERHRSNG
jgi:hypothetical protein